MLSQLSFRDSLTGLFNRNSFNHMLDSRLDERKFTERVAQLCRMMEENGIHAAAGLSWRCGKECSCKEQFEEADRLMYQDKEAFYDGRKGTDTKRASDNPA